MSVQTGSWKETLWQHEKHLWRKSHSDADTDDDPDYVPQWPRNLQGNIDIINRSFNTLGESQLKNDEVVSVRKQSYKRRNLKQEH